MEFITYINLGIVFSALGSILPSFLNLTVVKYSLEYNRKSAFYLIFGFCLVLFFQANIGAYLTSILFKNSEYIDIIKRVGVAILLILSLNFFRLYFTVSIPKERKVVANSKAFYQGMWMSLINTFAIPFYFIVLSFLAGLGHFKYTFVNGFYFSAGAILGSLFVYSTYAIIASKIENSLSYIATKMNLILGCLTGAIGIGNLISLV